jgi:hypothetical protein
MLTGALRSANVGTAALEAEELPGMNAEPAATVASAAAAAIAIVRAAGRRGRHVPGLLASSLRSLNLIYLSSRTGPAPAVRGHGAPTPQSRMA